MRPRLLLSVVLSALLATTASLAQSSLEYAVKAAYLAKFAPFIEWPESAFAGPAAPLTICILGPDPFGPEFDKAIAGQKDGDHPLVARRMTALDPAVTNVSGTSAPLSSTRRSLAGFASTPMTTPRRTPVAS